MTDSVIINANADFIAVSQDGEKFTALWVNEDKINLHQDDSEYIAVSLFTRESVIEMILNDRKTRK